MKRKNLFLFGLSLSVLLTSCGESNNNNNNNNNQNQNTDDNKKDDDTKKDDEVIKEYLITFKDEEGNVLESKKWKEGVVPSYTYSKKDTEEYKYTFKGWSETLNGNVIDLPKVSKEATYYAIITKTIQSYDVEFLDNEDNSLSKSKYEYGKEITKPTDPSKEGCTFIGWSYDKEGNNKVEFPVKVTKNIKIYAIFNNTVKMKEYLSTLVSTLTSDPYSYIPSAMRPSYKPNLVNTSDISYNFSNFTNVSSIKYGGFGEEWNMVIDNISQSELFYASLSGIEVIVNSSVALFNNYFDKNTSSDASYEIKEGTYNASINYKNNKLTYNLEYNTGYDIKWIGTIKPKIEMSLDTKTFEKVCKITLTENNILKYIVNDNSYKFYIKYGIDNVSRKALFEINKLSNGETEGHIYEFIKAKDTNLVSSCADFYINDEYATVVGNKASGILGFKGYINELYKVSTGKLLGYEVKETLKVFGIEGEYNTLWFNLSDIKGINSVKMIKKTEESESGLNTHDVYVNNDSKVFDVAYNTKFLVKTSRKYDIELRKQYFYSKNSENKLVENLVNVPMMFIQADNSKDTNFSDFTSDMKKKSGINASCTLNTAYLNKIIKDHSYYIDIFIKNKDVYTSDSIEKIINN